MEQVILPTETAGIDVVPAHIDLASTEGELFTALGRESILREAMRDAIQPYDYVLIDCPPNLGLLTVNGLVAADSVIIPVQTQFYAMKGLNNLVKVINAIRLKLNKRPARSSACCRPSTTAARISRATCSTSCAWSATITSSAPSSATP